MCILIIIRRLRLLENHSISRRVAMEKEKVKAMIDQLASDHSRRLELFQKLQELLKTTIPSMKSYYSVLERASDASLPVDESAGHRCFGNGSSLYFHARLETNGVLSLLPPERAFERRLFRKFGSHRFWHIKVMTTVPINVRDLFFGSPKNLYGRHWSLFWCKMGKSPQSYIMFAESGVGISSEDERSVAQLWEWCIPQALNPDITVGKFMKRLKLSFSQVTPAGVLPEGSVEVLPDFGVVSDIQEIDGCGLISKEGLHFVWREFCLNRKPRTSSSHQETNDTDEVCPYTGFQGRLGGFKGTWQLDESLGEGVSLQCRSSQYKYRLPQKCLSSSLEGGDCSDSASYDPQYDTMEVCFWDVKPQPGTLNTRLIQILEAGGVPDEHFLKCGDDATKLLSVLSENPDSLLKHLHFGQDDRGTVNKAENTDSSFVRRMVVAKVDPNDPVFLERRSRLVRKEFDQMRKKVNS
jgi:hypothetical protein